MMATNYRNDYIVTWTDKFHTTGFQEGFTKKELNEYNGETNLEQIKNMYDSYNERARTPTEKRTIIKIEQITKETIFQKFPK